MTLNIASSAFDDGGKIPREYTCEGDDTSPPLSWTGVPWDARSLVLIVDDPDAPDPDLRQAPNKQTWMRPRGTLPEDPLLHLALVVYASDRTLLSTGARPHALARTQRRAASLDHAMWFHHPPRFDDWILYEAHSPAAHQARALVLGSMYLRDGTRFASVAQEGLIRVR